MSGRGEQSEMWPPTWHTSAPGNRVWFSYTRNQWMAGIVLETNKQSVLVKPLGGTVDRAISLKWGEVFWHAPAAAVELRG